jgi:alpha-L-arabinofuranosidase
MHEANQDGIEYENFYMIIIYNNLMIDLDIVNKTVSLVAKRGSGKSVLLKYLVENSKSKFAKIFVICPTEGVNSFYKNMVDKSCIFDEWNENWADQLIKKMTTINAGKTKKKNVLIILDDCMSDTNFHSSPALKKLYTRGRHLNIGVIATCQYLNSLPPVCRNNADWCLVGQMNHQSIALLAEEYLSGDLDKQAFIKLYHKSTKDYNFLVINNNSIKDSDDLNQIYGIIRTPEEFC